MRSFLHFKLVIWFPKLLIWIFKHLGCHSLRRTGSEGRRTESRRGWHVGPSCKGRRRRWRVGPGCQQEKEKEKVKRINGPDWPRRPKARRRPSSTWRPTNSFPFSFSLTQHWHVGTSCWWDPETNLWAPGPLTRLPVNADVSIGHADVSTGRPPGWRHAEVSMPHGTPRGRHVSLIYIFVFQKFFY